MYEYETKTDRLSHRHLFLRKKILPYGIIVFAFIRNAMQKGLVPFSSTINYLNNHI